jgi:hypothetical protein
MPVKSLESGLLVLEEEPLFVGGNTLLTIDMITREAHSQENELYPINRHFDENFRVGRYQNQDRPHKSGGGALNALSAEQIGSFMHFPSES